MRFAGIVAVAIYVAATPAFASEVSEIRDLQHQIVATAEEALKKDDKDLPPYADTLKKYTDQGQAYVLRPLTGSLEERTYQVCAQTWATRFLPKVTELQLGFQMASVLPPDRTKLERSLAEIRSSEPGPDCQE